MKRQVSILVVSTLILILTLCACGQEQTAGSWQEQYDLGIKYLSEGNYEEAIIAFTAAIQIDPKQALAYVGRGDAYVQMDEQLDLAQVDYETAIEFDENNAVAYLGLADVYIRKGEFDKALEIITRGLEKTGDERLAAKKAELEEGNIYDTSNQERRMSTYDDNGSLIYYHDFTYEKGMKSGVTSYNASGIATGHVDIAYNEQGLELVNYAYNDTSGEVFIYSKYTYDDNGNLVNTEYFDENGKIYMYTVEEYNSDGNAIKVLSYSSEDGTLLGYDTYEYNADGFETKDSKYSSYGELEYVQTREYDSAGNLVRYAEYNADGSLGWYHLYQYDDNGNMIGDTEYDNAGNIIGYTEYN